jgi:UDP-N-acetylglucosamine 3-dehydrogenase
VTRVRTAVVGLGWAGTVHARALAQMPGIDLVALADPDPQRRAQFPGHPTVATLEQALARRVDYCVIATPTRTHEHLALTVAAAGIAALVEKPLAPDPDAAQRIVDAFATAAVPAAVGHTERHSPATAELARLLHDQQFGQLWQLAFHRQGPYPERITDVGVALDLAVHDLDLAAWLAGAPVTRVTAATTVLTGLHEDAVTATARLGTGLLAHLHTDRITPFKRRTVQVHTAAGLLTADAVSHTLTLHASTPGPGGWPSAGNQTALALPVPDAPAPFTTENLAMRDLLQGTPSPGLVPLADGAAAVRAAHALLHAARTGTAVDLTPLTTARP